MRTEPDLSSLSLDDYEVLSQALKGKCLIGTTKSPFLLAKIQESCKEKYAGCYDFWLYDRFNVWESRCPFPPKSLPALMRWVQRHGFMLGLRRKEQVSWVFKDIKEVKDADINI